ncbi:type II toxin-antitoxin system HipA family toxin YjjJ [Methylomagnum sp.]
MPTLINALERLGIASGRQLAEQLDISQASFSRLFQAHRGRVVQIGRGRAARYALRENLARIETPVPVWRMSPEGQVYEFGALEALSGGRFLFRDEVFDDLPWMLWDMRPQGFMGRGFGRRETALGLPKDVRAWSSEDILVALTRRGEDGPGDLIIGRESLDRHLAASLGPVRFARDDYPRLATETVAGDLAGSSAGGEQPKFAVTLAINARGVVVKFSPPVQESAVARRWADLLISEHLALTTLRDHGQCAVESEWLDSGGRVMLETQRFDRTPTGRRAMVSGTALDLQFAGQGENWSRLGKALCRHKLISAADAETLVLRHTFGILIGNTDMHLGNISFFTDDYTRFTLAPVYDMLPMRWAPSATGEMVERRLEISGHSLDAHIFGPAARMAADFWTRAQRCEALEGRFAVIAGQALAELELTRRKMAPLFARSF